MIDGIIREIEEYQTVSCVGYIKRFYEGKISEITAMISRLKAFMSMKVVYVEGIQALEKRTVIDLDTSLLMEL